MTDYYYFFLIILWAVSGAIVCISIVKNRVVSLLDSIVIFSWFYVFFRPLMIEYCDVNKTIYYWDETYYVSGAFVVAFLLLSLQSGGLIFKLPTQKVTTAYNYVQLERVLQSVSYYLLAVSILIVLIAWADFGSLLLPFNRGGGALSVSASGLEKYFYILRVTVSILMISSLFLLFICKKKKALVFLVASILVLLIFSKRGAVISPIIVFSYLYTFFELRIRKASFASLINSKALLFILSVMLLAFGGKFIFKPEVFFSNVGLNQILACTLIDIGQQEYDLLNPAVLKMSSDSFHIFDLPTAMLGGVIEHRERLINYPDQFLSATDKIMLEYNGNVYLEKKFGVSPNIFQYLFFYFSIFSVIIAFATGYLYKYLERKIAQSFFSSKIFKSYMFLIFANFLLSPHDFTLKYYVFYICVLVLLAVGYLLSFSLCRGRLLWKI